MQQPLCLAEFDALFTAAVRGVRPAPGLVLVDIEVPVAHVGVLDALDARAAAVRGGR